MTSLEILEQINFYGKSAMRHKDLLDIIRDEFEDEIAGRKISPGSYKDKNNQDRPNQITQFCVFKVRLLRPKRRIINEGNFSPVKRCIRVSPNKTLFAF